VGNELAAEILHRQRVGRFRLAEPGEDDPTHRQIGRCDKRQQLVFLAVEALCRR
jgi:hypothetical protein